jgi:hypothetical protein
MANAVADLVVIPLACRGASLSARSFGSRNGEITFLMERAGSVLAFDAERPRKRFPVVWEVLDGVDASARRTFTNGRAQRRNAGSLAFGHDLHCPVRSIEDPAG